MVVCAKEEASAAIKGVLYLQYQQLDSKCLKTENIIDI